MHRQGMPLFELQSDYKPAWDQPEAIRQILENFERGEKLQTLLWATGTGKTFTMANIIQKLQKPTLIISHNKTLAAQLATEFKHFFPKNAVHYFISYFDYYQPESYLPQQDMYIEKEATINQEIQMYRLATMASLLTRKDVIVVASASALYGLGQKEFFMDMSLELKKWEDYEYRELKKKLIKMQYQPVQSKVEPWMFDFKGEQVDIYSSIESVMYRLYFNEDTLEFIEKKDGLTFRDLWTLDKLVIRPATQYLQDNSDVEDILQNITKEMDIRKKEFDQRNMILQAHRIEKRIQYDVRMIRETWFVNGIENYSPYFDTKKPGETPNTILNYYPEDMLLIIDESHMTIPQIQAMPTADRARKINLINHGFRLPSAIDHRPIRFDEFCQTVNRPYKLSKHYEKFQEQNINSSTDIDTNADIFRWDHVDIEELYANLPKKWCQSLFVSATPAPYEKKISGNIVEQIIRPTWLVDPITYVYPKSWDYNVLINSIDTLLTKKPYLKNKFMNFDKQTQEDKELEKASKEKKPKKRVAKK